MPDPEENQTPKRTRKVRVRTGKTHPMIAAPETRMMDLPEDVAGQWDEDQWHSSPPGV